MSPATKDLNEYAPVPPVEGPANTEFCAAVLAAKDRAGVVVDVATDVVNKGLRLPDEKFVTVPEPELAATHLIPVTVLLRTCPLAPTELVPSVNVLDSLRFPLRVPPVRGR
jgi:hypothetical protein